MQKALLTVLAGGLLMILGSTWSSQAHGQDANALSDDAIVAERGGVSVTIGQLRAKVRQALASERRHDYFADGERVSRLVEDQLLSRQLATAARQSHLADDPEIQAEIDAYVTGVLARLQINAYLDGLEYPDAELLASERFVANKADFALPESRDVRHILIVGDGKTDAEALDKANQAWQALQNGESFDQVMIEYSEDPAESHNGWVRGVSKGGSFDPDFTAAAFDLAEPGDYSKPVRSAFGYHIIRLYNVNPARQRTFEEVKDDLVAGVRREQRNAAREAYLDTFRTQETNLNEEVVKQLPTVTP